MRQNGAFSQRKSSLAGIANCLMRDGGKPEGLPDDSPAFIALNERQDRRAGIVTGGPNVGRLTGQDHQKPDRHDTLPDERKSNTTFTPGLAA